MAWTLKNYQRGGVVDSLGIARPSIVALAKYVAHKADMPDIRLLFTPGMAAHRQGLAVDIQPGPGNKEGMDRLQEVIEGLDWDFWGIRYAAVNKTEYGGSWGGKERKRPQTVFYGTPGKNDGYHLNHAHIDVLPTAKVRNWEDVLRGENVAAEPVVPDRVKEMLHALDYGDVREAQKDLGLVVDGNAGPITTKALEAEMSRLDEIEDKVKKTNTAVGQILNLLRADLLQVPKKTVDDEALAEVVDKSKKRGAAFRRIDMNTQKIGK